MQWITIFCITYFKPLIKYKLAALRLLDIWKFGYSHYIDIWNATLTYGVQLCYIWIANWYLTFNFYNRSATKLYMNNGLISEMQKFAFHWINSILRRERLYEKSPFCVGYMTAWPIFFEVQASRCSKTSSLKTMRHCVIVTELAPILCNTSQKGTFFRFRKGWISWQIQTQLIEDSKHEFGHNIFGKT